MDLETRAVRTMGQAARTQYTGLKHTAQVDEKQEVHNTASYLVMGAN